MAHDCIGNTMLAVDEDYLLTVHSACFIKEGDAIYYNYGNSLMVSSKDLQFLKAQYEC